MALVETSREPENHASHLIYEEYKMSQKSFEEALKSRSLKVGVVGLGYVGLPLAVELAEAGFSVLGFEVDETRAALVNEGDCYIQDIPSDQLRAEVEAGRLSATTDFVRLSECDAISVCVPTPLRKTRDPDLTYILAATEEISRHLRAGQLVVLESTTYPGTTTEVVAPRLEKSGLKVGEEIFLAFSPERIDPGNEKFGVRNTPKIIGGVSEECTRRAAGLYGSIVNQVVEVSSPTAAEMVKLLENTFRAVNIGLVNEIAIIAHKLNLNVWEIIDAAATKPFGYMPFYPGPGLGGHCIPIDPHYLSWKLRSLNYRTRFIEVADEINSQMPEQVINLVAAALNDDRKAIRGSSVLILGVAYKRDINDWRESPAIPIIRGLLSRGAELQYHDPFVPELPLSEHGEPGAGQLQGVELTPELLEASDCVVLITDHSDFDPELIADRSIRVVDTRAFLRRHGVSGEHIQTL